MDIHIKVSPLLTHILLFHWTSVAKPKLRDKMKNFKMVTAEYYTKHGTLPSCGSLWRWWALLVTQTVKNLPAMQKTWLQSLGQKDPLEEEMATPVFLPGKSHGQRSLAGNRPRGCKESDMTEQLTQVLHS